MKALEVIDGDITFREVSGTDEVVQRIREIFGTSIGEWFLDLGEGFDYSTIQGKNINEEEVRASVQETANQIEEVENIEDIRLDFDRPNRRLEVFFIVNLANGEQVEVREVL